MVEILLHIQAECKGGARKVYDLLQKGTICNLGWQILFTSLVVYEQQLRSHVETSKGFFLPFSEGDARVLEAYLKVLKKVLAICFICNLIIASF